MDPRCDIEFGPPGDPDWSIGDSSFQGFLSKAYQSLGIEAIPASNYEAAGDQSFVWIAAESLAAEDAIARCSLEPQAPIYHFTEVRIDRLGTKSLNMVEWKVETSAPLHQMCAIAFNKRLTTL